MQFIGKIKFILDEDYKYIYIFIILYLLSSILEVVGLASIGTYLSYALDGRKNIILNYLLGLQIFPEEKNELLIYLGAILVFIFLLKAIYNFLLNRYIVKFSMNILKELRMKLLNNYLKIEYEKIMEINSAYYINLIQNMTYGFSIDVLLPVTKMCGDLIIGIVLILVLASVNWVALTILMALMILLIFGYDLLIGRVFNNYGKIVNESQQKFIQNLNEVSNGLKVIRVLGKENFFYLRAKSLTDKYCEFHSKNQVYSTIPRALIEFVLIAFVVLLILYTLSSGESLNSLIPTLSIFAVASIRLLPVANSIAAGITQARYGVDIVNTLERELRESNEIK